MGLFLEIIEYQETRADEISHRIPERGSAEFKLGGQCIVRENQVAIFCCGGKAADVFPPGRHTITTANIPVITKLLSLPWGFKSPIRTEIYFVNTKIFADLKWGTKEPITLRDTDFGLVRVRGFGRFAIRVTEPLVFINNLVGQDDSFRTDEIEDYLRDLIVSHVNDWLGTNMKSILDLPGHYKEFAEAMKPHLNASMAKFGIALEEFLHQQLQPAGKRAEGRGQARRDGCFRRRQQVRPVPDGRRHARHGQESGHGQQRRHDDGHDDAGHDVQPAQPAAGGAVAAAGQEGRRLHRLSEVPGRQREGRALLHPLR
ncbi:MAG: SPFH domain-containing protein [Planctomycetes bacterium]|nr:SPFH domain-containing protein [Planctomycetota bacterium]